MNPWQRQTVQGSQASERKPTPRALPMPLKHSMVMLYSTRDPPNLENPFDPGKMRCTPMPECNSHWRVLCDTAHTTLHPYLPSRLSMFTSLASRREHVPQPIENRDHRQSPGHYYYDLTGPSRVKINASSPSRRNCCLVVLNFCEL